MKIRTILASVLWSVTSTATAQTTGLPTENNADAPSEKPTDVVVQNEGVESAPPPPSIPAPPKATLHRFEREAMDTEVQFLVHSADRAGAEAAVQKAMRAINRVESLMSRAQSTSDISRINAAAGSGSVQIDPETFSLLQRAKNISEKSSGAYSITWAALDTLWNFNIPEGQRPIIPNEVVLKERLALVDDTQLTLGNQSARLGKAGMSLGLEGIAKGYAVDRAKAALQKQGFDNALVFVGGDISTQGKKGDSPWVVGLQEPRAEGYFAVLTLSDQAIATSGDYESYFEIGGRRYHHLLDPRTGMPAFGTRSVSAIAKDAASADAYATAIFVLGPERGLALVEQTPDLEVVIVDANNQVIVSTGLDDRLRILHQPLE